MKENYEGRTFLSTVSPWEKRGSCHTTTQTGAQFSMLYVGACLQHTNRCTQTNIPRHTRLQANTNKMGICTEKH